MFDPQEYFGKIHRTLAASSSWANPVKPSLEVEFDGNRRWRQILWRFETKFANGCRMNAIESHFIKKGRHYRKVKYRLMKADGELICQVDPHEKPIPFEDTPHFHIGPNEKDRFKDGDWKLNGMSLRDFDFLRMWEIARAYVEEGSVPWRI